jgi:hypothetical protein
LFKTGLKFFIGRVLKKKNLFSQISPIFEANSYAMFRKIVLPIVAVIAIISTTEAQIAQEPLGIIYNFETTYNLKLTTNRGYVFGMEKGRLRTYDRTTYYHWSIGEIHSPREVRQSAPPQTRYRSFVYGKQNALYALRAGWGVKRYLSEKAKVKGVAIGYSYSFGPTLGLVKPYYLALALYSPDNPLNYIIRLQRYSDKTAENFLNPNNILGAAPFTRGLSDLSLLPGGNASLAFHLDWGAFDERVKALELGIMLDVFPRPAPILVSEYNSPFFINFFANVQFGKRR